MRTSLACLCVLLASLCGCHHHPSKTYDSYQDGSVVVTDSRWEKEVDTAVVEVHRKMANWVAGEGGSKSDPTYTAGSKRSKDARGKECTTSHLEFTDADGNRNVLKTICIADKGILLIFCESGDEDSTIRLHNQLVEVLNERGFRAAG
ncbi:MAG: hypothetical protein KBE65_17095 [Phycisphaerae bacterium]|nr:hypothetical protein [Phycisphaerae bacterium]